MTAEAHDPRITLVLRRRQPLPAALVAGAARVTPARFAERHGADPADVAAVTRAATAAGLTITDVSLPARHVTLTGPAALLDTFQHEAVSYAVGLDDVPRMRPQLLTLDAQPRIVYTAPEVGAVYGFPGHLDGTGQTLAVICVEGGYHPADMALYFHDLGLTAPRIEDVPIEGATNTPGVAAPQADREATLDLQIAGALAPGALLRAYFCPNHDRGILRATAAAVHTDVPPTVVSISWGAPELAFTTPFRRALDEVFEDAAALGVTVVAATGDDGSGAGVGDGASHVMYPSSHPLVLACGGTTLIADPATGVIHTETTWNGGDEGATGGGVSELYPLPAWQRDAEVPARPALSTGGRGVPDVAAAADPMTGYQIVIQGRKGYVGGTSAATPVWAALVCRVAQELGRSPGFLQLRLYEGLDPGRVTAGFRDVVEGHNGHWPARPGWDLNTGLGSPDAAALLEILTAGS